MRKTKKNGGLAIADRITVLYGGIFTLGIFIISLFALRNASVFNQVVVKDELRSTITNIREYLQEGNGVTEEKLQELLSNKYVEVVIENMQTGEVASSYVGAAPIFMDLKKLPLVRGRQEMPPAATQEAPPVAQEAPPVAQEAPPIAQEATPAVPAVQDFKPKFHDKANGKGDEYSIRSSRGENFMYMENFIEAGQNTYFVALYKMLGDDYYYMKYMIIGMIIINLVGVIVAFLVGRYISRLMLKPVRNIRETAEIISVEDLSRRIDATGPNDEMKELSVTFNSMIDRLEEAFIRQNQFVSDASHELKTPISVIQGYAKLISRWGKDDPVVLQESIDSIVAETEHMSTLIKSLLFLAKNDQNRTHMQKQRIRLDELVADAIKDAKVSIHNRCIVCAQTCALEIVADPDLIKQLLWVHTENAVKYTKEDGVITYKAYKDGAYACVSISDNGVGIAPEDIDHIFDRFYRADKSRNKEIPGNGLGLSIALWIAKSNDGEIIVKSHPAKGTEFIDRFKLYQDKKERGCKHEK